MGIESIVGVIVSVGLLGYLAYALLFPQNF